MIEWIAGFVEQAGYLGIFLLMLLENVFPPLPSELIMPLAGFTAARGSLGLAGVVLAGTLGSLAGASLWYLVGRWVGCDRLKRWAARHGRWLTLPPGEIDDAVAWFRRHGTAAVLFGRLVPTVRTLISVPAGIVAMPVGRFLLYSGLGTAAWTAFLATAGYLLEDRYARVQAWVDPASNAILVLLVAWYLYRVLTFERQPSR